MYSDFNDEPTCLADVLKKIIKIEVVEDARDTYCILTQMPQPLAASRAIDASRDYDQQEEDMWYLRLDDTKLMRVKPEVVHQFRNVDLLVRVYHLNKSLLSEDQLRYLKNRLKVKDINRNKVTEADIEYLLDLIKSCNVIDYDFSHERTNEFTFDLNGNFREGAVRRVLKNLKPSDWAYRTRSINYNYLGNSLFVFKPKVQWTDKYNKPHYVEIYVKLDVSKSSSKTGVALVSFHSEDDNL